MTDSSVQVDEETFGLLAKRAEDKGFETTEEYINYVLEQVAEKARRKMDESGDFSEEDEEKVKKRLKSLGYLD
ncbi:MAG: CopG family transcriptional regulator [Candidatus Nanohaloarchaea archaeon]